MKALTHGRTARLLVLLPATFFLYIALSNGQSDRQQPVTCTDNQAVNHEGVYFTDSTFNEPYTGYYRDYYPSGDLRLELYLLDGRPEGTYVVYFPNARIQEVRAYRKGAFHGVWRSYNEAGMLKAQASYRDGLKHGEWMIWDDNGRLRYEMHYQSGQKVGVWTMWDEKGERTSEKDYGLPSQP